MNPSCKNYVYSAVPPGLVPSGSYDIKLLIQTLLVEHRGAFGLTCMAGLLIALAIVANRIGRRHTREAGEDSSSIW